MTNAQVLLVTGGWYYPNYFSSTEVSLQNHKVKIIFRTNFLNLYLLSFTLWHQFVLNSKSKIFEGNTTLLIMSLGVLISIQLLVLKNAKPREYLLSFSSFLPQIATYTSSSALSWRIVETGDLPSDRGGLRAAVVENVLYVSGGGDGHAILSWDPLQEMWTHAGELKVARWAHAVVAVPSNAIECVAVP